MSIEKEILKWLSKPYAYCELEEDYIEENPVAARVHFAQSDLPENTEELNEEELTIVNRLFQKLDYAGKYTLHDAGEKKVNFGFDFDGYDVGGEIRRKMAIVHKKPEN